LERHVIKRLLIANRGEIAIRIMRACRELAIETVAVYSDADANAAHVAAADRVVRLGPPPASESYLAINKIIDAARAVEADAIHPGYGFLSENAAFAAACEQAGIVFVGPPAHVMAQTGAKIDARRRMQAAGVAIVPGETPDDQTDEGIAAAVARVGLPVMLKASHGGGGKGMRRLRATPEIVPSVQAARREAVSAFGAGDLYVERLIEQPHHIEVQIFGDADGQIVHLFERECSVQRRQQKVIEESPSPNVTPRLRQRITAAAVRAARASEYRNAGTVEFLVDLSGGAIDDAPFYYLEMNSRLQVEHGVTEEVAGVDLVRAQLLVAAGEPLPWRQEDVVQRGHAIEARVYAEDPAHDFLPQAGQLLLYREPRMPGIRIDSGVREGDRVPVHYDPLLAKVVAHAETRDLAVARLDVALRAFPILGVRTNIPFLLRVLGSEPFRAGQVHTGFLDGEGAALAAEPDEAPPVFVQAAVATALRRSARTTGEDVANTRDPWDDLHGWRL
jgi:acetyl/propionyl-CoA carboxylase alpha subunit